MLVNLPSVLIKISNHPIGPHIKRRKVPDENKINVVLCKTTGESREKT